MAKNTKKEPEKIAASTGSIDNRVYDKSNMENTDLSTDLSNTQLWVDDENKYKPVAIDNEKGRHFTFIVYEDSAPKDWIEQLNDTGLPFVISPYHDKDVNPDGSKKKAHWHIIVSYNNTTTYRSIKGLRSITHGPYPQIVKSVSGAYAYLTHKHNPEKYQYDSMEIKRFNGWEKTLETMEVSHIKNELITMCFVENIREYSELVAETIALGHDYLSVAVNNTVFFDSFIRSLRHNPIPAMLRFYNSLEDETLKEKIKEYLDIELGSVEPNE